MRQLFLYGPPGVGKTTLGKVLADRMGLPFKDLDKTVQNAAGKSVREIFAEEGEEGFRRRELAALKEVCAGPRAVIALGGGTLLQEEAAETAKAAGTVVCLDCPLDILRSHINMTPGTRPLLANGIESTDAPLERLMEKRAPHYASFTRRLDVAGLSLDEMAERAETLFGSFRLPSGDVPSEIEVGAGILDTLGERLAALGVGKRAVVVADANTYPLYGETVVKILRASGFETSSVTVEAGEKSKTIESAQTIWRRCLLDGIGRDDTLVAVGGGVAGDLTGFAASTWLRGVRWANVPTTLLSMVDASIGGKTGIDLPEAKNMIGAFHAPSLVLSDVETLLSLPVREFRCGLAEAVKHAVIGDPDLVSRLPLFRGLRDLPPEATFDSLADMDALSAFVARAAAVKVRLVSLDPFEKGVRAKLNLGHTVGHAVEILSDFAVEHGEAVSIGMVEEAAMAERLGLSSRKGISEIIARILGSLGLPTALPEGRTLADCVPVMRHDKKKKGGTVRFALPLDIGEVSIVGGVLEDLGFDEKAG